MTYYMFNALDRNTFDSSVVKDIESQGIVLQRTMQIPVASLEKILDEHLPIGQHIDFFTIDCEGLDFEVLKSNNWQKYRPDYVLVETEAYKMESENSSEISKYLGALNYSLIAKTKLTSIFKQNEVS